MQVHRKTVEIPKALDVRNFPEDCSARQLALLVDIFSKFRSFTIETYGNKL